MAGLYLHIPFCQRKCSYCDFYSVEDGTKIDRFLAALEREIAAGAAQYGTAESIETIFVGGGTPSLLHPKQLHVLFASLKNNFAITADAEITVEVNPGTVDRSRFEEYLACGINRISIGVQSFHDEELAFLQRIHSSAAAVQCIRDAVSAGCTNVSIDLIFSLPQQTPERWQSTLQKSFELEPQHISAYSLIIEEQTPLHRMVAAGIVTPLPDDDDARLYEVTLEAMQRAGYLQYEVSNFARPGFVCKHNNNYWNHSNYISFGPSAHSFWKSGNRPRRWWNVRSLNDYCDRLESNVSVVDGFEELDQPALVREAIFLSLRCGTLDPVMLQKQFGATLSTAQFALLEEYKNQHLLVSDGTIYRLTAAGFMVCDEIAGSLL
ncbi:MAG: radical SAM family heme chaperone HemW [Ignavibacteriales bacterium]|nr:radical SAM family heme chaperone HemW [Ignavibacteriales bacterium]